MQHENGTPDGDGELRTLDKCRHASSSDGVKIAAKSSVESDSAVGSEPTHSHPIAALIQQLRGAIDIVDRNLLYRKGQRPLGWRDLLVTCAELEAALPLQETAVVVKIAGLVNGYHNDGTVPAVGLWLVLDRE